MNHAVLKMCSGWPFEVDLLMAFIVPNSLSSSSSVSTELRAIKWDVRGAWHVILVVYSKQFPVCQHLWELKDFAGCNHMTKCHIV